jgi:hypothetical protein
VPDPAACLVKPLSAEDEQAGRTLFAQLAADNFDTRERVLAALVAKGPAVLPLAQEFTKHRDPEVSSQAKGLALRILLNYDGCLPTSPALRAALAKKIACPWTQGMDVAALLQTVAAQAGFALVLDPAHKLAGRAEDFVAEGDGKRVQVKPDHITGVAADILDELLGAAGLCGALRGDTYLVTSEAVAERLAVQRHAFDWSELGFNRDEAERVGKALLGFFPAVRTEMHTASEVWIVRGREECLPRAARLIALLKPGAPDALWPAQASDAAAAVERLQAPVSLTLAAQDPLDVVPKLAKQGHALLVLRGSAAPGDGPPEGQSLRELEGAAPVRLSFREMPLGLVLRWVERRTKFPAEEQGEMALRFDIAPGAKLCFRLVPKARDVLELSLGGADVTCLYPRGSRIGAESDAAARAALVNALDSHLALFPACEPARDITVLRGRLLMQGPPATVARTLDLVRAWRAAGTPPAPAAWKATLDARLNATLDWDGREMTGGRVLGELRRLGNVPIMLEDAPDGGPSHFELTAEDAQLLPPGRYTLKALLDELTRRAKARWSVELGAVVLTPKGEEKE